MNEMIETFAPEMTFVIQGQVIPMVNESIRNIRKLFPGATVIVSTCNTIDIELVGADTVVCSEDPGALCYIKGRPELPNNVNRQIRSTLEGLKRVKTRYTFKLRTDFLITGTAFLEYFDQFGEVDPEYQVFRKKLLACCYYVRNPRNRYGKECYPYHVSDLAFFGLTEDLLNLFDIPMLTEEEAYSDRVAKGSIHNRYTPEQYLFISLLKKLGRDVFCDYKNDATDLACDETERYLASNFILLNFEQLNLLPTKPNFRIPVYPRHFRTCYTHVEWQSLYRKHVDPMHVLPERDEEREYISNCLREVRKYQFCARMLSCFILDRRMRKAFRTKLLCRLLQSRQKG